MPSGGDGKAVEAALGLGGAKCTQCTVTKSQKDDPKFAEQYWYPKNRSRDQNLELYQSLKKKRNGTIDTTVVSDTRLNMSQKPIGDFLDWTEALPITHLPIQIRTVFSLYKNQDQFMGSMNMEVVIFSS